MISRELWILALFFNQAIKLEIYTYSRMWDVYIHAFIYRDM